MKFLNNLSLKWKGVLIILLCLLGMSVQAYFSITHEKDVMYKERKAKIRELVNNNYDNVTSFAKLAEEGHMTEDEAKALAINILREVKYNEYNDYIFIFDDNGKTIMHGGKPSLEGKNLNDLKDPNGVYVIREIIEAANKGGDFLNYAWEREGRFDPKISYSVKYKPWGWNIGTGVYVDDVESAYKVSAIKSLKIISILVLVIAAFTWIIIKNIISPILATSTEMKKIANNENAEITSTDRKDELGSMARTLGNLKTAVEEQRRLEKELAETEARRAREQKEIMNKLANQVEEEVGVVVEAVGKAAADMQHVSETLAAASEETSRQSSLVADSSNQATSNVQTVAAASEEMSASIRELVGNVSKTATATKSCTEAAKNSQNLLETLQTSVDEIDTVIQSINEVAEQTNLLALNATIEAARAGEMGRGFAVVANEVKTLAGETNKMTEEIAGKVNTIKDSAKETINSVNDIVDQISSIDDMTASISSSIEEQNASTTEISRSASEAANFTGEVSNSITQVQQAAGEAAASTDQLKSASGSLTEQSVVLKDTVAGFVQKVRNS